MRKASKPGVGTKLGTAQNHANPVRHSLACRVGNKHLRVSGYIRTFLDLPSTGPAVAFGERLPEAISQDFVRALCIPDSIGQAIHEGFSDEKVDKSQ